MQLIQFTNRGIFCRPGNFYIDPWFPVDYALITHAHADHARWGMKKYLCHHFSEPILKKRIGEDIKVQSIAYNEPITINGVEVTFFPAGHIIGSAQIRLAYKGYTTVISGDYKLQDDGLSTPFEAVRCNEFVTESTFALPIYHWQKIADGNKQMQDWVLQNQAQSRTSVFVGYSLGKAQRIMQALEGIDDIFVHSSIAVLNTAFEEIGITLPEYELLDFDAPKNTLQGKIIVVPPSLLDSNVIKKIPDAATAICSGWMQVRGSRRWRSADAGFAISDHADWQALLDAVKATGAEKVHVTHGYADVFAKYLNELGIQADAVKTQFGNEEPDEQPEQVEQDKSESS